MARNKESLNLRNKQLVMRYDQLCNVKEDGVSKYSYELVMQKLKKEFFLQVSTMESIIKDAKRGKHKTRRRKAA